MAATLRFPGGGLAQSVLSYHADAIDTCFVLGTAGSVQVNLGHLHGRPLEHLVTVGESKRTKSFRSTDRVGSEMRYVTDGVLNDRAPETDAEEGYADVRVLAGIPAALRSATSSPELVNTANPGRGKEKIPKT